MKISLFNFSSIEQDDKIEGKSFKIYIFEQLGDITINNITYTILKDLNPYKPYEIKIYLYANSDHMLEIPLVLKVTLCEFNDPRDIYEKIFELIDRYYRYNSQCNGSIAIKISCLI
jgi:hypothetical protein